jgi:hypothetical protein
MSGNGPPIGLLRAALPMLRRRAAFRKIRAGPNLQNPANPVPLMDIHKLVKIIGEGD